MPNSEGPFGPIRQLGYVVEDLDAAMAAWTTQLGVGPWTAIKNITLDATYDGAPTQVTMHIALSYRDEMQIELIEQTNDAPSPYLPLIRGRRFGLHHVAHMSQDMDADLARAKRRGLHPIFDIRMPAGGHYVYLQAEALGAHVFVELLEATETLVGMFEAGIVAAQVWDGTTHTVNVIDFAAR